VTSRLQWWARATKTSLYFREMIFLWRKYRSQCNRNLLCIYTERGFLKHFVKYNRSQVSKSRRNLIFSQKINALKIKRLLLPTSAGWGRKNDNLFYSVGPPTFIYGMWRTPDLLKNIPLKLHSFLGGVNRPLLRGVRCTG
jgi:hypothetical protein